ncbi:hypothetical protein ABIF68_003875 [Bradyrhizobium japonicum]|uniref:hypothetical protein n=1 Tax=Bradyrhizobium TaxID=374 RepID=UPI001BABC307|nr:hypothetical protein [Bradyrhizobium japonicum]MBR0731567.1 hypothetical protein [Bradyrhizobium japonicum]
MARVAVKPRSDIDLLVTLDHLQRQYRVIKDGYRAALNSLMAEAMAISFAVEADKELKARFHEKVGRSEDTVYAVLIFITDAKSEAARKKASKRARALRYLVEELGTASEDIADAIREHGGIEKLARLAAQKLPRKKGRGVAKLESVDEDQESSGPSGDDEPDDIGAGAAASQPEKKVVNFGKQIKIGLSPKLGAKLDRFADRSRIRLTGFIRTRAGGSPTIDIKKITKLKNVASNERPAESASDWED